MLRRERTIYALIFRDQRCYVGQSIDANRRVRQHRYPSSGWNEDFESVILTVCHDNVWNANRLEFAWRWAAHLAGWRVLSAPGEFFTNLPIITWDEVKIVGEGLNWPFPRHIDAGFSKSVTEWSILIDLEQI